MFAPKRKATVFLLLFHIFYFKAQTYNLRIDVAQWENVSLFLLMEGDTFFIPTRVAADSLFPPNYSASLMRVKTDGTLISNNFYKRPNNSFTSVGFSCIKKNGKSYVPGFASANYHVWTSLITFDGNTDTIYTKLIGDTAFYNGGYNVFENTVNSNQLLITGCTDSTCGAGHSGNYKPTVRVIDTSGNLISTKVYLNTCYYRNMTGADIAKNKGYIMAGCEVQSPNTYGPNFVLRIDSNLNQQWIKYYGSTDFAFQSIKHLSDGNYILSTASLDSIPFGNVHYSRPQLIKIDEGGNIIWNKKYAWLSQYTGTMSVDELSNGDIVACGSLNTPTGNISYPTKLKGFIFRTDSLGNQKWFNTYDASYPNDYNAQNYLQKIISMPDGGFAAVGYVVPTDTSTTDTWLLRVDSMGCTSPNCYSDVQYLKISGEPEITVFPNPANDQINVQLLNKNKNEKYFIELFNSDGEQIFSSFVIGSKFTFETKSYANGLYFLKINSEVKIYTRKIIVQH